METARFQIWLNKNANGHLMITSRHPKKKNIVGVGMNKAATWMIIIDFRDFKYFFLAANALEDINMMKLE